MKTRTISVKYEKYWRIILFSLYSRKIQPLAKCVMYLRSRDFPTIIIWVNSTLVFTLSFLCRAIWMPKQFAIRLLKNSLVVENQNRTKISVNMKN